MSFPRIFFFQICFHMISYRIWHLVGDFVILFVCFCLTYAVERSNWKAQNRTLHSSQQVLLYRYFIGCCLDHSSILQMRQYYGYYKLCMLKTYFIFFFVLWFVFGYSMWLNWRNQSNQKRKMVPISVTIGTLYKKNETRLICRMRWPFVYHHHCQPSLSAYFLCLWFCCCRCC